MIANEVSQFDIFLVTMDSAEGKEINKKRPCVVVSPNEVNRYLETVIVAPITYKIKHHCPTRVNFVLESKNAQVVLDQIQTIYKSKLGEKMSKLGEKTASKTLSILCEMFAQ